MTEIIYCRELEIPYDIMMEVATKLAEAEIQNEIIDTNEEDETITIKLSYSKDEKHVISEIRDLIDDYEEEEEDDDEEENEEDDD